MPRFGQIGHCIRVELNFLCAFNRCGKRPEGGLLDEVVFGVGVGVHGQSFISSSARSQVRTCMKAST